MFALHHASCCSIAVKGKSCPACKSLCFQGGFEKEWKGLHIGLQAHFSFPFSFLLCYTPLMVKESGPPKAINIIRPTHSLSSRRRHAAPAELTESRKPKVASAAKISISSTNKHQLNIFHPPSRPQHHQQQPQKQPGSYEIYRPRSNLSRSLTTPSVSSSSSSSAAATARRPHYIPPTSASHNIISNTAPRPLTRSKTIVPAVSDASSSSSSKNAQASDSETTLRSSSNSGGGSSEDEDDDDDDSEDDKKQQGQSDDNEVEDDEISEARVNRKVKTLSLFFFVDYGILHCLCKYRLPIWRYPTGHCLL